MISGVGTDIIEITRIKKACENERFAGRAYTAKELEQCVRAESLAANFAAKEAFAKAVGTGFSGFSLKEVEILRDQNGKPFINLHGRAADICKANGIMCLHISLSHCREYATAVVIAEKE